MTSKKFNKLQETARVFGIPNDSTSMTSLTGAYTKTTLRNASDNLYQPTFLTIGNLKLTQEEYETCMRHLLEITKQAKPEEFI